MICSVKLKCIPLLWKRRLQEQQFGHLASGGLWESTVNSVIRRARRVQMEREAEGCRSRDSSVLKLLYQLGIKDSCLDLYAIISKY